MSVKNYYELFLLLPTQLFETQEWRHKKLLTLLLVSRVNYSSYLFTYFTFLILIGSMSPHGSLQTILWANYKLSFRAVDIWCEQVCKVCKQVCKRMNWSPRSRIIIIIYSYKIIKQGKKTYICEPNCRCEGCMQFPNILII